MLFSRIYRILAGCSSVIIIQIKKIYHAFQKKDLGVVNNTSIFTQVPGHSPIELIAYYEEFSNYYPDCEMKTKAWFVRNIQKDWVIFDCGANIGYYSILFSKLAPMGHVYSFEPTSTYDMLLRNLKYHGVDNVTPIKVALGKSDGKQEESIFRIWGKAPERFVYDFTTIDCFMKEKSVQRLDCIKIDVDSFDLEVLQGTEQTLIDHDPFVIVELNHALNKRNQSVPQALEWLAGLGYNQVFSIDYENYFLKRNHQLSAEEMQWPRITMIFEPEHI